MGEVINGPWATRPARVNPELSVLPEPEKPIFILPIGSRIVVLQMDELPRVINFWQR